MRLLQILWDLEEGTVEDVVNAHSQKERPNYKTTQTLLRIMEKKRFIGHEVRGRVFVFRPLVSRKKIDHLCVQTLVSRNFRGSAAWNVRRGASSRGPQTSLRCQPAAQW